MTSSTSSNGPGIGASPSAASQRSGLGMRESVAANRTARIVRLMVLLARRTRPTLGGLDEPLAHPPLVLAKKEEPRRSTPRRGS